MNNRSSIPLAFVGALLSISPIANAQSQSDQHAVEQPTEDKSPPSSPYEDPPLAEGTTIDEALRAAAAGPPDSWPEPVGDNPTLAFTFIEQLEFRSSDDQSDQFAWDAQGWIGNDNAKFWWKSEGAANLDGPSAGDAEFQALYAKPISPFWFLQAGLRYENTWGPGDSKNRTSLVLGLQGLAPYKFELEPVLFLTEDGDLLGRLTASYDIYITQRLALQPRSELNVSASDVSDWALGSGFNDLSLELRLRYEIRREFAPYVGLSYLTLLGETANIAESGGSSTDDLQIVFGIRLAF
jgi:copper resistance protein B